MEKTIALNAAIDTPAITELAFHALGVAHQPPAGLQTWYYCIHIGIEENKSNENGMSAQYESSLGSKELKRCNAGKEHIFISEHSRLMNQC